MMTVAQMIRRIYDDPSWWDVCKTMGYGGFPTRELAMKMKLLTAKYGSKKVAAALFELVSHERWVTRLNDRARKACFSILGPPPDHEWFYETWDHQPLPRPERTRLPEPEPDPILDGLTRLTATELDMKLRLTRATLRDAKAKPHERQLAEDTLPAVESEMVRRGEEIPAEEPEPPHEEPKKRTRKRRG